MGDFNIFHHMPGSSAYSIYFFTIGISAALFFMSALSWYRAEFRTLRASAFYLTFVLLAGGGSLLALGLPIYTGFDLTVHQNRPVWNTPLMPILFVALSLVSGAAVASFLAGKSEKLLVMLRRFMLLSAGAVGV